MKEATVRNLHDSKIDLKMQDIIFQVRVDGKSKKKSESLHDWLKAQPEFGPESGVEIIFVDDNKPDCDDILTVAQKVARAKVKCFQYTGASPDMHAVALDQTEMENLLIQWYAFKENKPIPPNFVKPPLDLLERAMKFFGIHEINESTIYSVFTQMAIAVT